MLLNSIIKKVTSTCHKGLCVFMLVVGIVCLTQTVHAQESSNQSSSDRLAHELVHQFWNDVKLGDVDAYSRLIESNFQGLNTKGIYNRNNQISGLEGLTVKSFSIKDLVAAKSGDTLVISYQFHARGTGIVSGPSIDVWSKRKFRWKLISHSYVPFIISK